MADRSDSEQSFNSRLAIVPGERPTDEDEQINQYMIQMQRRPLEHAELRHCPDCQKWLYPWEARPTPLFMYEIQGRCPDCYHINDITKREELMRANLHSLCSCGCGRTVGVAERVCTCPCKCVDTDMRDDADYEPDSDEEDDDVNTRLDRRTEQIVACRYGWQTNVVCDTDTENERRIYYEAPGHCMAGRAHDIGIPSESSLTNSDNTTGSTEVHDLKTKIEPWELEALHMTTGRSYSDLKTVFPDARSIQTPSPIIAAEAPRQATLTCPNCNRPASEAYMEWLQTGGITVCTDCGMTVRPQDPQDDPDWRDYHPSMTNVLEHCHCRCICAATSFRPPNVIHNDRDEDQTENDLEIHRALGAIRISTSGLDLIIDATGPETSHLATPNLQSSRLPQSGHASESESEYGGPDLREVYDSLVEANGGAQPSRTMLQIALRIAFSLPELQLSANANPSVAAIEDVEAGLESAAVAISFDSYEEALQYLDFAQQVGYYWAQLPRGHPLMRRRSELASLVRDRMEGIHEDDSAEADTNPVHSSHGDTIPMSNNDGDADSLEEGEVVESERESDLQSYQSFDEMDWND